MSRSIWKNWVSTKATIFLTDVSLETETRRCGDRRYSPLPRCGNSWYRVGTGKGALRSGRRAGSGDPRLAVDSALPPTLTDGGQEAAPGDSPGAKCADGAMDEDDVSILNVYGDNIRKRSGRKQADKRVAVCCQSGRVVSGVGKGPPAATREIARSVALSVLRSAKK